MVNLVPAVAQPVPRYVKMDARYDKVRKRLQGGGWQAMTDISRNCDIGRDDRCQKYPEAVTCSLIGVQQCNMLWKHNDGTVILVATVPDKKKLKVIAVSRQ